MKPRLCVTKLHFFFQQKFEKQRLSCVFLPTKAQINNILIIFCRWQKETLISNHNPLTNYTNSKLIYNKTYVFFLLVLIVFEMHWKQKLCPHVNILVGGLNICKQIGQSISERPSLSILYNNPRKFNGIVIKSLFIL